MQVTVGFAKIPEFFFFSVLFPSFFSCHCLNYVPKGGNNLCICKACEHSALHCQMEPRGFNFFVFFSMTMHHLHFSPLSWSQCSESKFDNCLLHPDCTRQNHLNPPKSLSKTKLSHFFLVLLHGTGIPYKCYRLLCCLGNQELCWDSLTHKSDIAKLHQDFLTQLVLHENLRVS